MNISANPTQVPGYGSQINGDVIWGPITDRVYKRIQYLTLGTATISSFGVVANVVNLLVFFRLGFNETINISLFSLAIADLLTLMLLVFSAICSNPWRRQIDWLFFPTHFSQYVSWMIGICTIHSSFVTAFINVERCLCVMVPLKVKLYMTPKVTTVFVLASFVVILAVFYPSYISVSFTWMTDSATGKSSVGIIYHARGESRTIMYIISLLLLIGSNVSVLLATIALVVSLKRKTKWRQQTTITPSDSRKSLSTRDTKVATMIISISCIILICHTVDVIISLLAAMYQFFEFTDACWSSWVVAQFLYSVNCSINIFFYYTMSSNFKNCLQAMFSNKTS